MSVSAADGNTPTRVLLGRAERLNRPERIALMCIIAGGAIFDFLTLVTNDSADPVRSTISIVTTLCFALYVWCPPVVATSVLGVAVAVSFLVGNASTGLLSGAIAAGLVLRLGSGTIFVGYLGGILIANALYLYGVGTGTEFAAPSNVAMGLVVGTVSGGVGYALRISYARGRKLEDELVAQAERERLAVLAERQWIAGELHDSIAHHLTVVAMHVQLLDDDVTRPSSQEAIRIAARKALADLRFVIELAEDGPRGTGVPSGDLADAISEASDEFRATGHQVRCCGDPSDENIPRGAEIILARIMRESSTNILKYAGPGEVRISVELTEDSVSLKVSSPLPTTPRREMPSTGTGLNRMAERVLGVRGEFAAGEVEGSWMVRAQLPLAPGPVSANLG